MGPGGAGTDVAGIPSKVVINIVSSETTAANELLSGSLNAAVINGPDRKRLTGSGYSTQQAINGGIDLLFNENKSRVTSDPDVRKALTMTMNRPQISSVVTEGLTGAARASLSRLSRWPAMTPPRPVRSRPTTRPRPPSC